MRETFVATRRVLVVDGDADVRGVLARRLEREGFEVHAVPDASCIDALVDELSPSLVLLEVPSDDPLAVIERLRAHSDVPAIVLVPDASVDCVEALEAGADAYVTKPLSVRETVAKARATLRRAREFPAPVLDFGDLVIDRRSREVTRRGALVSMPAREFDLLTFLASSPRQVFTRAQLLESVWSSSDAWLGVATVTEHIRRLRRRIEDDPRTPRWVVTVWSVGYRFEP